MISGSWAGRPSHPELLDFLAGELVRSGWSLKHVQRLILTSSTYRQASANPAMLAAGMDKDAGNRLLWHGPRRRLSAEEVRDAMLAVSGELNLAYGGKSVMLPVEEALVDLLYDPTQWRVPDDTAQHRRRSVYLIAKRNLRLPFMEVFDQPALLTSCARRETSTHAPQSLELLNGRISNELAALFARRLEDESGSDPEAVAFRAYELADRPRPDRERAASGRGVPGRQPGSRVRARRVQSEFLPVPQLSRDPRALSRTNLTDPQAVLCSGRY